MYRIHEVAQRSAEWLDLRKGRITGSKLSGLIVKRGTERKDGFYKLMAERLGVYEGDDELSSTRERGSAMEEEARQAACDKIGKQFREVGFITSEVDDRIALSPDGVLSNEDGEITEAIEIKCPSAWNHLRTVCEDKVPKQYLEQVYQYFIVVPTLQKLHFVSYDPRITARPIHVVEVTRESLESAKEGAENELVRHLEYQKAVLVELDEEIKKLAF